MDKLRRPHTAKSIEKIKNGMVLERLLKHYNGDIEMSATQVTVGLALLKKLLPDLRFVENAGSQRVEVIIDGKSAKNLTGAVRKAITGGK